MRRIKEKFKKNIEKKNLKSKFSKDSIWLILSQITLVLCGFSINLIIGKVQGASSLGIFNLAISYYSFFSVIFSFGLNTAILQKVSSNDEGDTVEKEIFSSNFFLLLFSSICLSLLLILISKNFPYLYGKDLSYSSNFIICFFALPFFILNKSYMAYFTGKRNQKMFALIRIFRWLLLLIFITVGVFLEYTITVLLYSFLITESIILLMNLIVKNNFTLKLSKKRMKDNISFGFKSYTSEMVSDFNDKLDIMIIAHFLTKSDVGIYSFLVFFVKSLYIFPGILQQNFNPIISKLWKIKDFIKINKSIKRIKKINLLIIIAQYLFVLGAYIFMINFLKKEFNNTEYLFIIASIGIFMYATVYWSGGILTMTNQLIPNIYRTSLVLISTVLLTFILCKFYGLLGAVIAVSLNGLIAFFLLKFFIFKTLKIKI